MTATDDTRASTASLIGSHPEYRLVEAGCGTPFVDVDENLDWPVPHRYVHGGFENTRTLFSFYLPSAERYDGRVLQFLEGGSGGHENGSTAPRGRFRSRPRTPSIARARTSPSFG